MSAYSLATALSVMAHMMEDEMNDWNPMHRPYGVGPYPQPEQDIWIMRDSWDEPKLTWVGNIPRAMNVVGLYWAPAKDGEGPPEWTLGVSL